MATNSFNLLSDAEVVAPKSFNLLSDAVIVPPNSFNLLSDALVLPASAFALTSDAVIALPQFTHQLVFTSDAVVVEGRQPNPNPHKKKTPKTAVNPCPTCLPLNCSSQSDIDRYTLEGPIFPFVLNCPAGWDCNSSLTIHLLCCNQDLVVTFTPEMTQEDRLELLREKMNECAALWESCDPPPCPPYCCPPVCPPDPLPCPPFCFPPPPSGGGGPPIQFYYNDPQSCGVACAQGGTFTWTEPAGKYLALTRVAANYYAKQAACKLANAHQICLLPIEAEGGGCSNQPLTLTIQAAGAIYNNGVVSLFWDVTNGSIPTGLTESDSGSHFILSGTPTTPGTYTFTVRATQVFSGDYQERDYSVTIKACQTDYGNVTPTIFAATPSTWKDELPSGHYKVTYINGAWRPGPADLWVVGDGGGVPARGYVVQYNDGAISVDFPTSGIYASQTDAELATAGFSISFYHTGGSISIHLRDSPYTDNVAGSPNPTFKLEMIP